jgi:hypothetical protein
MPDLFPLELFLIRQFWENLSFGLRQPHYGVSAIRMTRVVEIFHYYGLKNKVCISILPILTHHQQIAPLAQ